MKNNKSEETLLTVELYSSLVGKITEEIINLKKEQGECINTISTQKEVLKKLKKEVKVLQKNIRSNKKALKLKMKNLYKVNNEMSIRNMVLMRINNEFLLSEESCIDLNNILNPITPKQKKIK